MGMYFIHNLGVPSGKKIIVLHMVLRLKIWIDCNPPASIAFQYHKHIRRYTVHKKLLNLSEPIYVIYAAKTLYFFVHLTTIKFLIVLFGNTSFIFFVFNQMFHWKEIWIKQIPIRTSVELQNFLLNLPYLSALKLKEYFKCKL